MKVSPAKSMHNETFFRMYKRLTPFFYNIFLLEIKDSQKIIDKSFEETEWELSTEEQEIVAKMIPHIDEYVKKVSTYLSKTWTWERVPAINKAILFVSTYFLKENKFDKALIINESINFTKSYSDKESFKFINAILDKISNG